MLLGEMANSRARAGRVQNKPASNIVSGQKVRMFSNNDGDMSKRHRS